MLTMHAAAARFAVEHNIVGTTAFGADAVTTCEKCTFTSGTWHDSQYLFTNSPVLFPRDDTELGLIVTTATANGCKVRVRGAGHSEDGIVVQKLDELEDYDTIVVNLKDYLPSDAAWDGVLDASKPSIKISRQSSRWCPSCVLGDTSQRPIPTADSSAWAACT